MAQTATELKDVDFQGLIKEDVMNKLWQIDNIRLELSTRIGTDSHSNQYASWTTDTMLPVDVDNGVLEDADATKDNTSEGKRIGNHSQISTKDISVTERARNVDTIGYTDALLRNISKG